MLIQEGFHAVSSLDLIGVGVWIFVIARPQRGRGNPWAVVMDYRTTLCFVLNDRRLKAPPQHMPRQIQRPTYQNTPCRWNASKG